MSLLIGIVVLLVSTAVYLGLFSRWNNWYDRSPKRAGATCVVCITASLAAFVLLVLSIPRI